MAQLTSLLAVLLWATSSSLMAACPFDSVAWESLRTSRRDDLLEQAKPDTMGAACFRAYLRRLNSGDEPATARAIAALRAYARGHEGLSPTLLAAFVDASGLAGDSTAHAEIIGIWQRHNGPFREVLARFQERGMYPAADTLCRALHALGGLDVYDLLRWAQIKGIVNDHAGAARVFCEIMRRERNLVRTARAQLARQLSEVEQPEQRGVLAAFSRCRLQTAGVDSASHLQWLAMTCARFDLHGEEVDALVAMGEEPVVGRRLLLVAEGRFRRGLYERVTRPASEAFGRLSRPDERRRAAVLAYQAYMQRERVDSALVWFTRAGLSDPRSRGDAIVLYQLAGLHGKADSVLALLSPSPRRDTLALRRLLFTDKQQRAWELADSLSMVWRGREEEILLWRARTAVFAGKMVEAKLVLDSATIAPSHPHAREILHYRYAVKLLGPDPAAFSFWGKVEHARYTDEVARVAATLDLSPFSAKVRGFFAALLARELLARRLPEPVPGVLDQVPDEEQTPRLRYFRAEALVALGQIERARTILEQLIVDSPGDIYSSKARIYLMHMSRETGM